MDTHLALTEGMEPKWLQWQTSKANEAMPCRSSVVGPAAMSRRGGRTSSWSQPQAGPAKHTAANFALIPLLMFCNPLSERDPRCTKALLNLSLSQCTHTRGQPQVHQGKQGQHQASTFDLRNKGHHIHQLLEPLSDRTPQGTPRTPQTPATGTFERNSKHALSQPRGRTSCDVTA